MDSNTVIEGNVKFRDGKKWKLRWCVMNKMSPVADCLHLQLYRDSKDRFKNGTTKASLSLQHFLGLEAGFTLDKESNTIAVICQDLIVILAFDSRERLIQWQVKIFANLPEGQQYLIQVSSSPAKAKITSGPAKLHIQDRKFCMTTGVPPKLVGFWEFKHLRRFGVIEGKFCFEGGSLCGKGEGLYILLTDQGEEITHSMRLASEGRLESKKRPLLRNSSANDSPCRRPTNFRLETSSRLSEIECDTEHRGLMVRNGTVGRNNIILDDAHWPSVETQTDMYGHGDTASLADFSLDSHISRPCGIWMPDQTLGRCSSCIGKLGIITRTPTAANTPASITFNPIWVTEDIKEDAEFHYNDVTNDKIFQQNPTDRFSAEKFPTCCCKQKPLNFVPDLFTRYELQQPPSRPPKPARYQNLQDPRVSPSMKKICKPPMPLPIETLKTENSVSVDRADVSHGNYDVPRNLMSPTKSQNFQCDVRDVKKSPSIDKKTFKPFPNYDVPPPAVPVHCASAYNCKTSSAIVESLVEQQYKHCICHHQVIHSTHQWMHFPVNLNVRDFSSIHKFTLPMAKGLIRTSEEHMAQKIQRPQLSLPPQALYATVDLSKKTKNKRTFESNTKDIPQFLDFYSNMEYSRIQKLNYMNLEFSNSLKYYENVKDFLDNIDNDRNKIDSLNIDVPYNFANKANACLCVKCGHVKNISANEKNSEKEEEEDYIQMGSELEKSASSPALSEIVNVEKTRKISEGTIGEANVRRELFKNHTMRTLPEISTTSELKKPLESKRFVNATYKPGKNRDSSSSNDSGFSTSSLKYAQNCTRSEASSGSCLPFQRHYSFNQQEEKEDRCCVPPRRSKSSDPLKSSHFQRNITPVKLSSTEGELPIKQNCCNDCITSLGNSSIVAPYVDYRSNSSGTSDMSDYIETLSLSSHSSSDVADNMRFCPSAVTTLRPRFGTEYQKIDRTSLMPAVKKNLDDTLKFTGSKSEMMFSGYSSDAPNQAQ